MLKKSLAIAALSLAANAAGAQQNENGYGPDPDGDTNPATKTRAVANIGATDVKLDPRFTVMTFEPPPGAHRRAIRNQYQSTYGVSFSKGLEWQICDGERHFAYDSLCTYIRPPSGSFAGYYRDDWREPLKVAFKEPVCAIMMSIYPPGGREGEIFRATLRAKKADGSPAGKATVKFAWTQDAFRWRVMVGGFFLKDSASSVEVMVRRVENGGDVVQFLVDDLAYVKTGCADVLEKIRKVAGFEVGKDGDLVTRSAQEAGAD
ncbi:MAG: hypothetical protein HXY21_05095 [Parvularculaceae bacterium]|nr:hypothetical protein [Parvularculaceae bacterium]